jgi:hypothetical protein
MVVTPLWYHLVQQGVLLSALIIVSLLLANNPSADDIYKPLIGFLFGLVGQASAGAVVKNGVK